MSRRPDNQMAAFGVEHPSIALSVGRFRQGSTNITSNAARISFAFDFCNDNGFGITNHEGEGTLVNALRHVAWQSCLPLRTESTTSTA